MTCIDTLTALVSYPGYSITRDGRVWSNITKTWLKLCPNNLGYTRVNIRINGIKHRPLVHRLVGETFIPNKENKAQINHLNGVRSDNRTENLVWATQSENMLHAYKDLKRTPPTPMKGVLNWDNPKSTPICKLNKNSPSVICVYASAAHAARELNISQSHISQCCNYDRDSSGGYSWRYAGQ